MSSGISLGVFCITIYMLLSLLKGKNYKIVQQSKNGRNLSKTLIIFCCNVNKIEE